MTLVVNRELTIRIKIKATDSVMADIHFEGIRSHIAKVMANSTSNAELIDMELSEWKGKSDKSA